MMITSSRYMCILGLKIMKNTCYLLIVTINFQVDVCAYITMEFIDRAKKKSLIYIMMSRITSTFTV